MALVVGQGMLGARGDGPVVVPPIGLEIRHAHVSFAVEWVDAFDAAAVSVFGKTHHGAFSTDHHRCDADAVAKQRPQRLGIGHSAPGVVRLGKPKLGNAAIGGRRITGLGVSGPSLDVAGHVRKGLARCLSCGGIGPIDSKLAVEGTVEVDYNPLKRLGRPLAIRERSS